MNAEKSWLWTWDWSAEDDSHAHIVYFRRTLTLERIPEMLPLRISADSRYKLYVNGSFVQEGPQKALDLREWFVDTAQLTPYLKQGENVLAVEVLRYGAQGKVNDSLLRTKIPCLYLEADAISLACGKEWKCSVNREIRIVGETTDPAPIQAQEEVNASGTYAHWKEPGYDDSLWQKVRAYLPVQDIPVADAPGNLVERTVPYMRLGAGRFLDISAGDKAFAPLLTAKGSATIPAHTTTSVELSAGEEQCAYLLYAFAGGRGARVTTLCSECYCYPQKPAVNEKGERVEVSPRKGDRTDAVNGVLLGHTSTYTVAGYGTMERSEHYEPFWMRTFRYVRLTVETGEEPLTILDFSFRTTGYPLEVVTQVETSDPSHAPIWDISVRTLRRCMHDTYMDCPFYEQLQYAMDSRSEILYTYALSADDRLARQTMEAFRRSQRPDGLLNCDAPTVQSNVIPGFSIYYILMVHDHMMYFGDKALVRLHLSAIDRILSFFDANLTPLGLVGKVGGTLFHHRCWSYIDWSEKWDTGMPNSGSTGDGSIVMESLLYLYGLEKGAELARFVGRNDQAAEYLQRADFLKAAIRSNAMGVYCGIPMVQDGPDMEEYSVHAQVFAVLTGLVTPEEGKKMLCATIGNREQAQSSVAFMFYLFRALEICGWYEKTDELWELWRGMVRHHLTTCVENGTDERSDCHAWASLICYELPSTVLGVRPAAPGYEKILVRPVPGYLTHACGTVHTPKGDVQVSWRRENEGLELSVNCADSLRERLVIEA